MFWATRTTPLILALLLIAVLAPVARAEPATQPSAEPTTAPADVRKMDRWLADLASADAGVRDAARLEFMKLSRHDLPALQQLVKRNLPLAPSQAASLRQIVQEVYLSGEPYEKDSAHGFLGILMDEAAFGTRDLQQANDTNLVPGVVVTDRIPGFCAARMLRDGDVILGTTEPPQVFNTPTDLKQAIGTLEPGSVVRLQVLRQGQVIQVPLTLDCRPLEADSFDTAENFRVRRAEKFNNYWEETFAVLLKETLG